MRAVRAVVRVTGPHAGRRLGAAVPTFRVPDPARRALSCRLISRETRFDPWAVCTAGPTWAL